MNICGVLLGVKIATVEPRIETIPEKKLVGKRLEMSFADNKTAELWSGFMSRRREISTNRNSDLISMQIYGNDFWSTAFDPQRRFEKWATIEVADLEHLPDGMEKYTLPGGMYAVFLYRGHPKDGAKIFQYIFGTWLPSSGYILDNRPHFEVLGERYKNDSEESEEEIWIPVSVNAL